MCRSFIAIAACILFTPLSHGEYENVLDDLILALPEGWTAVASKEPLAKLGAGKPLFTLRFRRLEPAKEREVRRPPDAPFTLDFYAKFTEQDWLSLREATARSGKSPSDWSFPRRFAETKSYTIFAVVPADPDPAVIELMKHLMLHFLRDTMSSLARLREGAERRPSPVRPLQGFSHMPERGIDSMVGVISRANPELAIRYDIGTLAGLYADPKRRNSYLWFAEQEIGGMKVFCAVRQEGARKRLMITFPEPVPVNFYAYIESYNDVSEVLLTALTYSNVAREESRERPE